MPNPSIVLLVIIALQLFRENDLLQIQCSHHTLSPDVCVLCIKNGETHSHLFLHCTMAWKLWANLMNNFVLTWVAPSMVEMFMNSNIQGVGVRKEAKTLGNVLFFLVFGVYG